MTDDCDICGRTDTECTMHLYPQVWYVCKACAEKSPDTMKRIVELENEIGDRIAQLDDLWTEWRNETS